LVRILFYIEYKKHFTVIDGQLVPLLFAMGSDGLRIKSCLREPVRNSEFMKAMRCLLFLPRIKFGNQK
jgi:hypothetical protein